MERFEDGKLRIVGKPFAPFDEKTDVDEAWLRVRLRVQEQLTRNNYITLPTLSQSNFYNLWCLFLKQPFKQSTIRRTLIPTLPSYLPCGPVTNYALSQSLNFDSKLAFSWKYYVRHDYRYYEHVTQGSEIELTATDIYESFAPFLGPNELQLNVHLLAHVRQLKHRPRSQKPPSTLWIVHSVLWAERVVFRLRYKGKDRLHQLNNQILGFQLAMYKNEEKTYGWLSFPVDRMIGYNMNGWFLHPNEVHWPNKPMRIFQKRRQRDETRKRIDEERQKREDKAKQQVDWITGRPDVQLRPANAFESGVYVTEAEVEAAMDSDDVFFPVRLDSSSKPQCSSAKEFAPPFSFEFEQPSSLITAKSSGSWAKHGRQFRFSNSELDDVLENENEDEDEDHYSPTLGYAIENIASAPPNLH